MATCRHKTPLKPFVKGLQKKIFSWNDLQWWFTLWQANLQCCNEESNVFCSGDYQFRLLEGNVGWWSGHLDNGAVTISFKSICEKIHHWVPFRPSNQQCRLQIMGCYASVSAPLFVICLFHRREIVPMFNIFGWDGIAPQKKERRVEKTHITTCRFVLNDIQYMYTVYIYIIYNTCIYIYIIYIYIIYIYRERGVVTTPTPPHSEP